MDRLCSKLVLFSYCLTGLDKHTKLVWNSNIKNLYCFIVLNPGFPLKYMTMLERFARVKCSGLLVSNKDKICYLCYRFDHSKRFRNFGAEKEGYF
jgi:hypothetical protein